MLASTRVRKLTRRFCAARALLISLLLFTANGFGQTTESSPQEPAPSLTVLFTSNGDHGEEVAQLFEAIVRARRGEVRVVLVPSAAEPSLPELAQAHNAVVTVFLDTRDAQRWRLALANGSRTFRRELPGGIAQDAAIIEASALIAARGALALLEAPEAELPEWTRASPAAATKTSEPQVSNTKKRPVSAVRTNKTQDTALPFLGAAASGTAFAPQAPLHVGATLLGGVELPVGLILSLGVSYFPELSVATDFGSFELHRYPSELRAGWRLGSGTVSATAGLGFTLELQRRSRGRAEQFVAATAAQSSFVWGLAPYLGAAWRLSPPSELALTVAADLAKPNDYVAGDAERSHLLTPYPVRPRAELSVTYYFGAVRSAQRP